MPYREPWIHALNGRALHECERRVRHNRPLKTMAASDRVTSAKERELAEDLEALREAVAEMSPDPWDRGGHGVRIEVLANHIRRMEQVLAVDETDTTPAQKQQLHEDFITFRTKAESAAADPADGLHLIQRTGWHS
jgi:hypothetical protein